MAVHSAIFALVDLADYPMPIYNGDLEAAEGIPEKGREFKRLLTAHVGILISSPEYNGAFSSLLKNVPDWASRAESTDGVPLAAYRGKVAAIMSASPGGLGLPAHAGICPAASFLSPLILPALFPEPCREVLAAIFRTPFSKLAPIGIIVWRFLDRCFLFRLPVRFGQLRFWFLNRT